MQLARTFWRRSDRVRGSGWLDCPNCKEHAHQDVVDEMSFVCLLYAYRLTPVRRHRVLVCRRCGFRRPATAEEMRPLQTSGRPIKRAWLVPVGLSPFIAAALITLLVVNHSSDVIAGISFGKQDANPVAQATFEIPVDFNHSTDVDTVPHVYNATSANQTLIVHLRRIEFNQSPEQLIADHYADDQSTFQDNGFPEKVTTGDITKVKVGGVDALRWQFDYKHANDAAQEVIYAFNHNGVGYTLTFQALGAEEIKIYAALEKHMVDSFSFAGNKETAAPSASPSAGATPSTGATPAPATPAAATPSPTP